MSRFPISRRGFLLSGAAAAACGPPKAAGFPGYCLVANRDSRSVAVVDLNRFRLRKQISLDAEPSDVLAHPAQPKAFALAPGSGTVYEIDTLHFTVSRRARAGNQAISMALLPGPPAGDAALWVLYRNPAALVEIPLASLKPRRRIALPAVPDGFDINDQHQAAVASYREHLITIASLAKSGIQQTIEPKDEPSLIKFQKDGKQLIAGSHPGRNLTIYQSSSGKTVVRLPLAMAPRNFCPSSDGGQLYVTGDGADAVAILYPYQTEVAQTVLAGHAPGAMAVTGGDSPLLLVANPESDRITALDVNTQGKTLVTVVEVGQRPSRILVAEDKPSNSYALVLNEGSGDLAVIRMYSLLNSKPFRRPTPVLTMIPVGEKPCSAAIVRWA